MTDGDRKIIICYALGLLGALLALGSCAHPSPRSRYASEEVRDEYYAAASIKVECVYPESEIAGPWLALLGGGGGFGSGVAVGPGSLMTARHVIDCEFVISFTGGLVLKGEPWKITVTTRQGVSFEAVVEEQGEGPGQDAALLVAAAGRTPFLRWASVAEDAPRIGDQLCVMSAYPWFARRCGTVSDFQQGKGPSDDGWMGLGYAVYDIPSDPGNSGSGVYDESGRLVAIHVASVGRHAGGGYLSSQWRRMVPERLADLGF